MGVLNHVPVRPSTDAADTRRPSLNAFPVPPVHRFRTRSHAIPVLALTMWSVTGCYRYVPVSDAAQSSFSSRVQVRLAARGTLAVRGTLGENVRAIEGTVTRATNDSLYLNAEHTTTLVGVRIAMLGTPVAIARTDALSIAEQQHSRRRSILTAVVIGAGVTLLITAITLRSSGTYDDPREPPPVTRIPH